MRSWRNSFLIFLILGVAALVYYVIKKENGMLEVRSIEHCMNCEVVVGVNGEKFDPSWYKEKYQIVVFSKTLNWELSTFNLNWKEVEDRFPQIQLVFVYGGKDKGKLQEWILEKDFSNPVIADLDGVFQYKNLEGNPSGIVFNLKNGEVQSLLNPTFGEDYLNFLEEMIH